MRWGRFASFFWLTFGPSFGCTVSSLIAQGTGFPLRKPAGFHWDLFLLGLTTGIAGLLGIPYPNGLIPQAPFHTASLCVTKPEPLDKQEDQLVRRLTRTRTADEDGSGAVNDSVVEQRVSNLAQGLLTLGTMTGPLLFVVHLIPQAVLAGLFFIMGFQALEENGITGTLLFLARDDSLTLRSHPLRQIRRRRALWLFVGIQLLVFAATFAITQTLAAVAFPVFIILLIPARATLLPKWFDAHELALLDGPTAGPLALKSVGGSSYEHPEGSGSADEAPGPQGGRLFPSGETTAAASEVPLSGVLAEEHLAELGENQNVTPPSQEQQQQERQAQQRQGQGSSGWMRRRVSTAGREYEEDGIHELRRLRAPHPVVPKRAA
jgi:hypothetical protein